MCNVLFIPSVSISILLFGYLARVKVSYGNWIRETHWCSIARVLAYNSALRLYTYQSYA